MNHEAALTALRQFKTMPPAAPEASVLQRQIIAVAEEIAPELCQQLRRTKDSSIKIRLLNLIGNTRSPVFVPTLQQILAEKQSAEVLQIAATNLGKLGNKSFKTLVDLLQHPSPNVRLGAIYGLHALGNPQAIPYLLTLLGDNTSVAVWWPSPKAGGYIISRETALVIDQLSGRNFKGDRAAIEQWLQQSSSS